MSTRSLLQNAHAPAFSTDSKTVLSPGGQLRITYVHTHTNTHTHVRAHTERERERERERETYRCLQEASCVLYGRPRVSLNSPDIIGSVVLIVSAIVHYDK